MKKIVKCILLILSFVFATSNVVGQELGKVEFVVEGITMDAMNLNGLPYVNVICTRNNQGVTSNGNGGFSIKILPGDTLLFRSVGYETKKMRIIPDNKKEKKLVFVYLKTKSYELEEVDVEGQEGIPKSMQSEVFKEDPNALDAVLNPMSFMYYKFNKKEKRKRDLRDQIEQDNSMAHVLKVYNKDLIKEFSGLEGDELEQCIIYCNTNIDLSPRDTEQSIKMKLLNLLSIYFKK